MTNLSLIYRKLVIMIVSLLCSVGILFSQSNNRNYIHTRTMLDSTGTLSFDRIDYFDGLGRLEQSVQKQASSGAKDIVTLQEYDNAGRPANSHIAVPVGTSAGAYVTPPVVKAASVSFYGDAHAYEKPVYEASPLGRVMEQYGPGAAWHTAGKSVGTEWYSNSSSGELSCGLYAVASPTSLERKGLYAAGELYVTKTEDEDGHVLHTFTDKQGRVILERVMDGTVMNDTYYVYDHSGNLCYVLPPAAADVLGSNSTWADSHTTLKEYAYVYKYDARNRCIRKRLPGCESVEMRYDRADRLIFSQDGNQQSEDEWMFQLYDLFGRLVVTGIWGLPDIPGIEDVVVRASYDPAGSRLGGYTVNLSPLPATVRLMAVNYYDGYGFLDMETGSIRNSLDFHEDSGYDARFTGAKGLLTGSRTYRLDDPSRYTVSAMYYDHRGRVVQGRSTNHLGGYDMEYFTYTFTGKVKEKKLVHSSPQLTGETQTETYHYDYGTPQTNPTERLLSVKYKLNGQPQVILSQYTYDNVGRVETKTLGGETLSYSYNVRGWMTRISGLRFNQTLAYNAPENGITPDEPLYSGNISAMKWKSGNESTERGYRFSYDNLGRLTAAVYGEGVHITANPDRFNEVLSYDRMGNITTLQRRGNLNSGYGPIDNLAYTYTGNQLTKVTDAVSTPVTYENAFHFVDRANAPVEYEYDDNGNLTKDLNRNIDSIAYNSLNLPDVITFTGDDRSITYVYDAGGSKLSVVYRSGGSVTRMDYADNKIYKNGALDMLLTEEGYVTPGQTPAYHYYLKDHQGNNRVVINGSGMIRQVNHYYPFGGLFGEGLQDSGQRFRYNGKEFDRELGLDMSDYGARHYDPALGRWFTVDPLAEKYYLWSPYVYVMNNPTRYIDPLGMDAEDRVRYAKELTGISYPNPGEKDTALRTENTPEALEYMDCSELVCRVLASDQITDGIQHMNSSGLKDFVSDDTKFLHSEDSPQLGDMAVWDGHVGIVTAVSEDGASIKLTHARGVNKPSQENPVFLTPDKYSTSNFHGYYRPINETPSATISATYEGGRLPGVTITGQSPSKREIRVSLKNN